MREKRSFAIGNVHLCVTDGDVFAGRREWIGGWKGGMGAWHLGVVMVMLPLFTRCESECTVVVFETDSSAI
jgi:hypothetical protein